MSKNRVRVNIAGSSYVILSEEKEEYIRSIAEEVDKKIENIKKSSTDISSLMGAILTAMDFCDFYRKSVAKFEELNTMCKNYITANEQIRFENCDLRKQIHDFEIKIGNMNTNSNENNIMKKGKF